MDKPNLVRSMQIPPINMQKYERYLPSAFDESLSLLEKVNKVIHYLYEYSAITDEMLTRWNEVYDWVMNNGLNIAVSDKLNVWLEDGTLKTIINEEIFNDLNTSIINLDGKVDGMKIELDKVIEGISLDVESLTSNLKDVSLDVEKIDFRVPTVSGSFALGEHPLVKNPVLEGKDITDYNAKGVADPFIVYENNLYYMFFEIMEQDNTGHIGLATSSDGLKFTYRGAVLTGGNHWAYPYVFKHEGVWYMLPDTGGTVNSLSVYRATNFPYDWVHDYTLVTGESPIDPTLFQYKGVWYLSYYNHSEQATRLYYNENTFRTSNWTLHPRSPILKGWHVRNGGRAIVGEDSVELMVQEPSDDLTIYGERVRSYRLSNLSPSNVVVTKSPKPVVEAQGTDQWHNAGMHHVDIVPANKGSLPIAVTDGVTTGNVYAIGVYTVGDSERKPYLRAIKNEQQMVATDTWTKLSYDLFYPDNEKAFNKTTNEYRIKKDGLYYISVSTSANITNTPNKEFVLNQRLLRNGVEYRTSPEVGQSTAFDIPRTYKFSDVLLLKENDLLTIEFYQNSGATIPVLTQGWSTWFNLVKVD